MSIKKYIIIETILLFIILVFYILDFAIDIPEPYQHLGIILVGVMVLISKIIRKKERK